MEYIRYGDDHDDYWKSIEEYEAYLEGVKEVLPTGAKAFAFEPWWRRDGTDHRALHDSWVESVTIRESVEKPDLRGINVELVLLGPYHDYRTKIEYRGVEGYVLASGGERDVPGVPWDHGDLLVDELTLSAAGRVRHEIWFSGGARWTIHSHDVCCTPEAILGR